MEATSPTSESRDPDSDSPHDVTDVGTRISHSVEDERSDEDQDQSESDEDRDQSQSDEDQDQSESDEPSEAKSLDKEYLADYPFLTQESQALGPMSQLLASVDSQRSRRAR